MKLAILVTADVLTLAGFIGIAFGEVFRHPIIAALLVVLLMALASINVLALIWHMVDLKLPAPGHQVQRFGLPKIDRPVRGIDALV